MLCIHYEIDNCKFDFRFQKYFSYLFSASRQDEISAQNTSQSTPVLDLARLPKAPDDGSASSESSLSFQEVKYRDGGAHWYRSSAVMLASHK